MRTLRLLAFLALCLAQAATLAAQQPLTLGDAFALDSKVMAETRQIIVWTPAGYASGARRYPVLYLTDAERQFAHTVTTAEFLARNGRMPELIVVGILNTDRTRDLTPYKDGSPEFDQRSPTAGGADTFLRFIETELVPWVEGRYRTEPYRMFAGHSFGGLFAVHALATRPDVFNAVIAVSPTLMWRQGEPVARVARLLGEHRGLKRALYVSVGDEGPRMQAGFDRLKRVLEEQARSAFRWKLDEMKAEDHGSIVLRSHYAAFESIFDGWRLPRQTDGTFKGGPRAVVAHYASLSDRLGWGVTPPEPTVNLLGYASMAAGRTGEAIEYFRSNAANYPDSANVYDSLGEGLEAAGKPQEALAEYERAVALAEKSGDPLLDAFRQHRDGLKAKLAGSR